MTEKSIQDNASYRQLSFPYIYGENIEHIYTNVTVTIERITPEVAEKMLKANIDNRKMSREPLAQAIENDEWKLNGATIVFDDHGILRDGQHRLYACIRTGVPIDTFVVRGVSHDAQITMDTGIKRSLKDYLEMNRYKNVSTVGAVGMGLLYLDTFGTEASFNRQSANLFTVKGCFDFVQSQYDSRIEPLVHPVMLVRSRFGNVTQSRMLGIVFDQFRKAGDDNLQEFVGQLCGKRKACVSVGLLNNKLSEIVKKTKGTGVKPNQRYVAALIVKTWNAYMRGDDIKQLKFMQGGVNQEKFPEIFLGYE